MLIRAVHHSTESAEIASPLGCAEIESATGNCRSTHPRGFVPERSGTNPRGWVLRQLPVADSISAHPKGLAISALSVE